LTGAWSRLGLRGRLAVSIGLLVTLAFAVVFGAVSAQMAHETDVIKREEGREQRAAPVAAGRGGGEESSLAPIEDAQEDVRHTFLLVGGATLVAALLAGYLLAARTASPLRRFAATAARVDAGDLSPRLDADASGPVELRVLAEAFNRMLDRLEHAFAKQRAFVSDASHELRTPLTAIRGQLEVLSRERDPGPEEVRRVERHALAEMRRVERIVEDLLSLARLDEGAPLSRAPVEVGPFLRDLAHADGAELGEVAAGAVPADADLLAQAIRNLLANADRHAARTVLSAVAEDDRLELRVDDDGPGIPPEQRDLVFERFHRIDPGRERERGGSGLGLGIARSIVETHGGRIGVGDSPLGGARVWIELPGFRADN
jgi:two-component system, OmpR family, sensor kinase